MIAVAQSRPMLYMDSANQQSEIGIDKHSIIYLIIAYGLSNCYCTNQSSFDKHNTLHTSQSVITTDSSIFHVVQILTLFSKTESLV